MNRKRRGLRALCAVGVLLAALLLAGPPSPSRCALCGNGEGRPYHAPCVVECATGLVAELAIYDPAPERAGTLAPEQDLDRQFFQAACGGRVARSVERTGEVQRCVACVPKADGGLNRGLFCRACRRLLAGAGGAYVLADLRDPGDITAYPIQAGGACRIREYTVSVAETGEQYRLEVRAALF